MNLHVPETLCRRVPFRLLRLLGGHGGVGVGQRRVLVPLDDAAAFAWIYWRPGWKHRLLAQILPQRPGVFIDIGANAGQTLADFLATGVASPYIGFEPNPQCLAFLNRLVRTNLLPAVSLVPLALSNRSGLARLHIRHDDPVDSTATLRPDMRPGAAPELRHECIPLARLDDLRLELRMTAISLIKIDVEGSELEVIEGMQETLAAYRPVILCEVLLRDSAADSASYQNRVERLAGLLHGQHYAIHRIHKTGAAGFARLSPVDGFPLESWSPARSESCDYLFAPSDFDVAPLTSSPA